MKGTWIAALALSACAGLYANTIGTPHMEFRHSYALRPNGQVRIQNLYGDVAITAWDRDEVLVEAVKNTAGPRGDDDARVVVDGSADELSIRTQYAGGDAGHPTSVNYRIMVPRTASLADIELTNGGLSIRGVAGPVKASAVNGSIRAERLQGRAELSTVNGQLEAGFSRVSGEDITLRSVNGAIRLFIPGDAAASLEAENRSGGIESEFGHPWRGPEGHRLRTVLNQGGAAVRLHNVNGGIFIRTGQS
ncbi:MAG TPA: DUF4097 family beta strand repeat-containing protein [Bryobacteraceae bacterium]|jgi:DUF4097 and DUF4098 domain-containing protein YvlB|nr:DUF4097 family beta strand repeat-containing protein [Bryobacteraceae bacterium]